MSYQSINPFDGKILKTFDTGRGDVPSRVVLEFGRK